MFFTKGTISFLQRLNPSNSEINITEFVTLKQN